VTGQRIGEVLSMERSDIDCDKATWNIPAEKSKNGLAHSVPLSSLVISLVEQTEMGEGTFLFRSRPRKSFEGEKALDASSVAHALRRCLPSMGFAENPFRTHDLRRTCATGLAELGIAESTIARVLNHKSEIGKTITGRVYIQHGYEAEKRRALDAWSAELQRIVAREDLERN